MSNLIFHVNFNEQVMSCHLFFSSCRFALCRISMLKNGHVTLLNLRAPEDAAGSTQPPPPPGSSPPDPISPQPPSWCLLIGGALPPGGSQTDYPSPPGPWRIVERRRHGGGGDVNEGLRNRTDYLVFQERNTHIFYLGFIPKPNCTHTDLLDLESYRPEEEM